MKRKTAKTMAILISVLMLIALLPVTAFAAEPGDVCEINGVGYDDFETALEAVPAGGTEQTVIKLLTDVTYAQLTVIINKKITFDLNGYDLIFTNRLRIRSNSHIDYTGTGSFEINMVVSDNGTGLSIEALSVQGGSTCKIAGITIINNSDGINQSVIGADCRDPGSSVVVNGDITAAGNENSYMNYGIFANNYGNVTVNGNIMATNYIIGVEAYTDATVTVNGNITVNRNIANANDGIGVQAYTGGTVTVNGTIDSDAAFIRVFYVYMDKTDITTPTTKDGYFTYSLYSSAVWVKDPCANGHDWGEWLVTVPPTYDDFGVEARVCDNCVETETGTVPKLVQDNKTMLEKFNEAIENGDWYYNEDGSITVVIDGIEYVFTSKSGNYNGNGTLFCTVNGVEYKLDRNAKGIKGVKY